MDGLIKPVLAMIMIHLICILKWNESSLKKTQRREIKLLGTLEHHLNYDLDHFINLVKKKYFHLKIDQKYKKYDDLELSNNFCKRIISGI